MYDFAYQKPSSLADAVKALSADPDAKALAGGMTLIPVLKQRLNKPSLLVDLAKLGLVGISVSGNTVTIGGDDDARRGGGRCGVKAKIPALAEMASHHRRRRGAASRHDRRQPGEQRPGRRLSGRRAGAGRHDQDRPALDQGATTSSRACSPRRWNRAS